MKAILCALMSAAISALPVSAKAETVHDQSSPINYNCDVAVVGAGAAGLSAALTAANLGARVLVFDKMPMVGGDSFLADSEITAANSILQRKAGLPDGREILRNTVMTIGKGAANAELVDELVDRSGDAVDWLIDLGASITRLGTSNDVGGLFSLRASIGASPVGPEIVKALLRGLERYQVPVETLAMVTELTTKNGVVTGIKVINKRGVSFTVNAPAVVIATGGFAANRELLKEFSPDHAELMTNSSPAITGDGILMATKIGAQTVDMSAVQCHPTTQPLTGTPVPGVLRSDGAILVNFNGERFVDETTSVSSLSHAVNAQSTHSAWEVFDASLTDSFPQFLSLLRAGLIMSASSDEELALKIGVPPENFVKTLAQYRAGREVKADVFGRRNMPSSLNEYPLYAVKIRPVVHYTMGGLEINKRAEVLNAKKHPIAGLYAAGEVTGGIHGLGRVSGIALTDAVVFGRIAGESATARALMQNRRTSP